MPKQRLRQLSPAALAEAASLLSGAVAFHQAGLLPEAERLYRHILQIQPRHFDALHLLGVIHVQRGELIAAVRQIDAALQVDPRAAAAHSNRGVALKGLGRIEEALASYDRTIALQPGNAEAHNNRGVVLNELRRSEEALVAYERAVALKPDYADAHHNRGAVLQDRKRYEEALASYDSAIALKPNLNYATGDRLFIRMQFCDWRDFETDVAGLSAALARGVPASSPFPLLATPASPAIQRKAAELYTADRHPPAAVPLWRGERYAHDRIRVAYLSADFHDHATAHLMAGLFERHDRSRFETFALSFGPDDQSDMRQRLQRSFDRFTDLRAMSDQAVAALVRSLEIDIAVDLKGITLGARTGIFARRPAPVAVNYLGYPGTMGAPYVDYLIADRFVIPKEGRSAFSEQVVVLPGSYQPNDATRAIAGHTPSRGEVGLPDNAFVFCCFNNSYKITPDLFEVWMRLLREVEGSVLWLLEGHANALANLRREAELRGITPERLVFAPRIAKLDEHLARHRLADLFLDTHYYNAHTTASDALWAGLPLITCAGTTFASRVAGSLLHAAGLPELVSHSLADYETLALALARDPGRLAAIRQKLAGARGHCPLFDTQRSTRHLEAAYTTMWQRYQRGEPPQRFAVSPIDEE